MNPGSIVLLHLREPNEKYWGRLLRLDAAGVTLRGLNLSSFKDWMVEAAGEEAQSIAPTGVFFPMHRIECIFLDERVGSVESYVERFETWVGEPLSQHLPLANETDPGPSHQG